MDPTQVTKACFQTWHTGFQDMGSTLGTPHRPVLIPLKDTLAHTHQHLAHTPHSRGTLHKDIPHSKDTHHQVIHLLVGTLPQGTLVRLLITKDMDLD